MKGRGQGNAGGHKLVRQETETSDKYVLIGPIIFFLITGFLVFMK